MRAYSEEPAHSVFAERPPSLQAQSEDLEYRRSLGPVDAGHPVRDAGPRNRRRRP